MTELEYTSWQLELDKRVTAAETTLADLKKAFDAVRPQLAITSFLGSTSGGIIVSVVIWWMTKK